MKYGPLGAGTQAGTGPQAPSSAGALHGEGDNGRRAGLRACGGSAGCTLPR